VDFIPSADELKRVTARTSATLTISPCSCGLGLCTGWESVSEDRWPQASATPLGTLRDPDIYEPTFEEHHPEGTRYASAIAPVAVKFFPYNRAEVWHCTQCQRHLMRYTEFGGYYVDHRVRELSPQLTITD
jgi:hypothetical protein